ncbi:hypothetical protein QFZ99_007089 [Paraburkholderia atlantica]
MTIVSSGFMPYALSKVTVTVSPCCVSARTPSQPAIAKAATGTAQIQPGHGLRRT